MENQEFRAILIKIQDRLSDNDRKRLHFFFGNDVPRRIRDDPSLGGTLSLMESLFDQDKINDQDFTFLTRAFDEIQCQDAAKLLRGKSFSIEYPRSPLSTQFRTHEAACNRQGQVHHYRVYRQSCLSRPSISPIFRKKIKSRSETVSIWLPFSLHPFFSSIPRCRFASSKHCR